MRRFVPWMLVAALAACEDGGTGGAGGAGGAGAAGGGPAGGGGGAVGPDRRVGGDPDVPVERRVVRFEPAADPPTTPLAAVPFPSDLYRSTDGRLDLRGFPRPTSVTLLERYIEVIERETGGFATSGTLYLSFDGPVDERGLPADAAASLEPDSSLFIVDVDPDSAERGRRFPIHWRFSAEATTYLPANTLSVRLVEGVVLRPRTTYALVVTERVGVADERFAATLADDEPGDPALAAAWQVHAPLRAWLAEQEAPIGVAGAAVFTTQDPVSELFVLRDFIHELPPPPLLEIESRGVRANRFELFEGRYEAPRFQEGTPPFSPGAQGDGGNTGRIRFDERGRPVVQGTETLRFALAVPLGDPPPDGWPVVMYAHGTGGDWHSFIDGRVAAALARQGVASISIDQIHHGPRDNGACGGDPTGACRGGLFFNFLVPTAGRDNVRQSALDFVSLLRFVRNVELPADISRLGAAVRLRRDDVMFMGHSQGGLNGPLFLAVESEVRGGMLSGAGANFAISIEQKKQPTDINQPVRAVLRLPPDEPLDRWHPVVMLLQTFIEPADGHNYAPFWFARPAEGYRPKSIFMTVGLEDEYTPPDTTHALAAAAGVPIIDPVAQEVEALSLLGVAPTFPPYRGNVAGGEASAGLAQYPGEGHFVIFRVISAQQRYANFLRSLATEHPPQIF